MSSLRNANVTDILLTVCGRSRWPRALKASPLRSWELHATWQTGTPAHRSPGTWLPGRPGPGWPSPHWSPQCRRGPCRAWYRHRYRGCAEAELVTNSTLFCWLFTIKGRCKKVGFQQTHNQGPHQLFLTVSSSSEATHEANWGPLRGAVSAQKVPQGAKT